MRNSSAFEREFELRVLANFDEAESIIRSYRFLTIRQLIHESGALAVARNMVDLNRIPVLHQGLIILAKYELTRCSIEQAVINVGEGKYFSKKDVTQAGNRLWYAVAEAAMTIA